MKVQFSRNWQDRFPPPWATRSIVRPLSQSSCFLGGHIGFFHIVLLRRLAHTDVRFPTFDEYRRESTLDVTKEARQTEDQRRMLPHLIYYGVGGTMALLAAKESMQAMVAFKGIAKDQMALANTVVQLEEIPEGETKTYEWQGKPVFVKHRTDDEIKREKTVDVLHLRHPQHDDERVQRDEWLVLLGICTHLGCVPIPNSDEFPGGFKCPCHGAYFDASGRIRRGPAPLNLRIPPYTFVGNTIVVGTRDIKRAR
uniref:Cytochrome b-c1 complex subunit Rieske, mitochondrial n=1 Tax=Parascaris univalens TaxID=6257 RepID=A0A915AXZ0_PARUN